jgi:tellurite resistance protein TerC
VLGTWAAVAPHAIRATARAAAFGIRLPVRERRFGSIPAVMTDLFPLLAETASNPADLKLWAYVGFLGLVVVFLALDLGVFHREAHEVSMKEAATWSVIWLTCGLAFSAFVYKAYDAHWLGLGLETPRYNDHELAGEIPEQPLIVSGEVTGGEAAQQYLVGYVVEKSLAMDNIFVIALIFAFFAVPAKY